MPIASLYVLFCFLALLGARAAPDAGPRLHDRRSDSYSSSSAGGQPIMLVSGIMSFEELCLAVDGGAADSEGVQVNLMPCVGAISAGDGRELFVLQPNGQLATSVTNMCVGLLGNDVVNGGDVVLMRCDEAANQGDGRSIFELRGDGQIKLGRKGEYCLSQHGAAGGLVNVALHAAAAASSTTDKVSHGASMAVDGKRSTYWASDSSDSIGSVEFVVDFGKSVRLHGAEILWEFPAKAFSIQLSVDGARWTEAFATDTNGLNMSRVPLGSTLAAKAKVLMREPHAIYGQLQGRGIYGIAMLSFIGGQLQTVVDECDKARTSVDARDKFFPLSVGEADPYPSGVLRKELPALQAARASMAAAVAELSGVLPMVKNCPGGRGSFTKIRGLTSNVSLVGRRAFLRSVSNFDDPNAQGSVEKLAAGLDDQIGVDSESLAFLMRGARAIIIQMRAAFN